MGKRFTDDQERAIVAAVRAGEPAKAVARRERAPYSTVVSILHRHRVSSKATDDPERLRLRERWARAQRAQRERRKAEMGADDAAGPAAG